MNGIFTALTDAQRAAVAHRDGPLLILAGPGSGKTRVVTHRVAHLRQQGIPDTQILALTFTNKAADEMRSRLDRLAPGSQVWMGTFHRFCSRLLRQYAALVGLRENFSIYDVDESQKLLREAITDAQVELIHETPARIATAISWAKNKLISPAQYQAAAGSPLGALVARVYPHYQRRLLSANAADFDDLLMHVATLLREHSELRAMLDARLRYILVDEYQDTNLAQYAIVRALSVDHPNLAVTGDPDQSIYGWRGATIRNILEFERDFPAATIVRLEQNYRSTKSILRAADGLIAHNRLRKAKSLFTDNPEGSPVRVVVYPTGRDEADAIACKIANEMAAGRRRANDYAVFYRTNALSRTLERALTLVSVPYQIVRGLEFYQRKEIKDVLAYLRLLNNPADDAAWLRVINTPPRRIGATTIARLGQHAREQRVNLLEAAREASRIPALTKRAVAEVAKFVQLLDRMQLAGGETVEEVLGRVLEDTGYSAWLEASQTAEDQERIENLDELLSAAREFDEAQGDAGGLEMFLEQAALVADVDDWNSATERVTMMTLHAAKGLEFPVVFIVAVEEDVLPHARNKSDDAQFEEERRLLFVGMTRAKEELQLSAAQVRTVRGSRKSATISSFLLELPRDDIECVGPSGTRLSTLGSGYAMAPDFADWDDPDAACDAWDAIGSDESDQPTDEGPWQPEGKPSPARAPSTRPRARPVVTAADLAGARLTNDPPISPEVFQKGMVVIHPAYGVGKIVALGGSGAKRAATVQFASEPATRRFRLAFSPLRPGAT